MACHDLATTLPMSLLVPLVLLSGLSAQDRPPLGLAALPVARHCRALQFSSWDRAGGNEDTGNFLRVEDDGTRVLAELDGPGRITRIWSATPHADVRIELDGTAVFSGPLARLFDQGLLPFTRPLAGRWGGGHLSHVPMPFLRRLRITSPPGPAFYYQIGVELGAESERFTLPPGPVVQGDIAGLLAGARTRAGSHTLVRHDAPIVGRRPLLHRPGSGELIELRVRIDKPAPIPGALWLEIRYDGQPDPAFATPLDDLFATLPEQLGDGDTLRLPMPFHDGLALHVVNRRTDDVDATSATRVSVEATFRDLPADHSRLYLHARHRRAPTVWGQPFAVLDVQGRGHFVGLVMRMHGGSGQGLSYLEGDETITVDGDVAFHGTGTEDWFSGAWYFAGGVFRAPFHALSELDHDGLRTAVSRFHIADAIPFERSLRFDLEHGGNNDAPHADYRAIAFWYSDSPVGHAPEVGSGPATPPRTVQILHAHDRWPEHTQASGDANHPFLTRLPAGHHAMPGDTVVTLFAGGRAVHGPVWLQGDSNSITLPAPIVVDALRLEPILPAIRAFRVCGPFPGGERQGIGRAFGPERNADPDQRYDEVLGDGVHGWRDVEGPLWPQGYLDLNPLFQPNDEVVAYAATEVHSPRAQDGVLWLGSDDAVAVFLNGERIHEHRGLRGATRDQDRIAIKLRRGHNRLLIKVEDYFGGFGLFARIDDAEGLTFTAR